MTTQEGLLKKKANSKKMPSRERAPSWCSFVVVCDASIESSHESVESSRIYDLHPSEFGAPGFSGRRSSRLRVPWYIFYVLTFSL
jgi:hypothetical protein